MIKNFSVLNFKALKNLTHFSVSDLNIVVGRNSCGKTSILQSLLLLKQSINSDNNDAVTLEGDFLTYSNLKELSNGLPPINNAKISYSFDLETKSLSGEISFEIYNKKENNTYKPAIKNFTTEHFDNDRKIKTNFDRLNVINRKKISGRSFFDYDIEVDEVGYFRFLPSHIKGKPLKKEKKSLHFPLELALPVQKELCNELYEELSRIRYLGPLRASPKRAYVHFSESESELLYTGENAAHVLWLNQNKIVSLNGQSLNLVDALNKCISIAGLSQEITPSRIGNLIYKINLNHNSCASTITLADVGFGYSQLIPIILLCLLAPENSLILLEQPEIHLHPSSAANLADLFLMFINSGLRFIIETHSVDLVNKLRLRVIQDSSLVERVSVAFVEESEGDGTIVKQRHIDADGMFDQWPKGFLDDSEKIALSIMKERANKRSINKVANSATKKEG